MMRLTEPPALQYPAASAAQPLFLSLPLGITVVVGAIGRSELCSLGGEVSFLGFFAIFWLRWSPLAMRSSERDG